MRQIGSIPNESEAQRLAAYLITQGVSALAEPDGDVWAIWVHDENQLERAKEEFENFRVDPTGSRYRGAVKQADSIKRQEAQKREQAQKNVVEMRGRWGRPGVRKKPLTLVLIGLCVAVTFMTNFARFTQKDIDSFGYRTFVRLTFEGPVRPGDDPNNPLSAIVNHWEVWRLITPIFLHGSELHIIFNMIWLFVLGSQIEARQGTLKLAMLVLVLALICNLLPCVLPNQLNSLPEQFHVATNSIGFSGVGFGLLGYMWMKSAFEPQLGMRLGRFTVILMVGYIIVGFAGYLDKHIDNWAHLIGLVAGVAIGYATILVRALRRTSD